MPAPIRQLESVTSYLADGATTAWNFSFASGYLNKAHVKAYTVSPTGIRADLTVTLGMFLGPNQLSVTPAVTSGYELNIYRDTPTDAPLVNFADTASFTETSLDTSTKQAIFAAAETVDALSIATERVTQINALVDTAVTAAGTATTKAGLANGSAIAAGNSAAAALLSEQNAAASALSVVQSNLVHIAGAETVTGNKTFSGTTSVAALTVTTSAALPAGTTGLTKTTVGLGNVDNVADVSKPVSTAQATAIALKMDRAIDILANCKLTFISAAQLRLVRFQGPSLSFPDGTVQSIPAAGVNLASTGLLAASLYYVYAWMNAGVMTLEASTTGHTLDATSGIEIKVGDATRVLVGMAYIKTAATFEDIAQRRFVRSWFNEAGVAGSTSSGANITIGFGPWGELSAAVLRCEFIAWAGEQLKAEGNATVADTGGFGTLMYFGLGYDFTTGAAGRYNACHVTTQNYNYSVGAGFTAVATEGIHYLTPIGGQSAGTVPTFSGGCCGLGWSLTRR